MGRGNHLGIKASNLGNLSKMAQKRLEEKIEAKEMDFGDQSGHSEVAENGRNNEIVSKKL